MSTSSSHSSTLSPTLPASSPSDPFHSFTNLNMVNITKLSSTNYLTWSVQIKALLKGYDLIRFIDTTTTPPSPTLNANGIETPNPDYSTWLRQDSLLFSSLMGTIETSLQPLIASASTTLEAWNTLASTYAKPTRGHIKQLKQQLKLCVKGTHSIDRYMQLIKSKADALALLGSPVDHEDLTDIILEGLGDEYKSVIDSIHSRDTPISFAELHEKLINRELSLPLLPSPSPSFPMTANVAQNRPQFSSQYRPNHQQYSSSNDSSQQRSHNNNTQSYNAGNNRRPYLGKCQACGVQGHSVKYCPHFRLVSNPNSPQPQQPRYSSQPRAYAADLSNHSTPSWLLDSGASHHITSDLANLTLHTPYAGRDEVLVGNGEALKIDNTGSLSLSHSSRPLQLKNVLHVPRIAKNLISVKKLCTDNLVSVEFFPDDFQVKDLSSGAQLITGKTNNGSYEWPDFSTYPISIFNTSLACPLSLWHSRLGHPSVSDLQTIVSKFSLRVSNKYLFPCNSCSISKSHKLPFSLSSLKSTQPLELLFSDVWTSPVHSIDGFKYYTIFVDHYTHYVWLYPLRRKSDVLPTFIKFKNLVENRFRTRIITLFSDNGGEYVAMSSFLADSGITHLTSPPHTPEQNGFAERRHRHIVETGLALLSQASIPTTFWTYALSMATYLINRLPTPTLSNSSPFESLFGSAPNYTKLKVFGCLCYPWLRPYTSHKLDFRSKPCVFLGYSQTQSAYLCLDPSTQKIFISRHVKFFESQFSFSSVPLPSPPSSSSSSSSSSSTCLWLPPILPSTSHSSSCSSALQSPLGSGPSPTLQPPMTSPPPSAAPSFDIETTPVTPRHSSSPSSPSVDDTVHTTPSSTSSSSSSPAQTPTNIHPMQTRAKSKIIKPNPRFAMFSSAARETEPKTVSQALKDARWRSSMRSEYDAQIKFGTWELVPPDPSYKLLGTKWIFRIKRLPNGDIDKLKSRFVAKGFHQRPGLDYEETFSPVIKSASVRLILGHAVDNGWDLRQLDINNAFLQGALEEDVYISQPQGFVDPDKPHHVCKLRKALYGLKQAPRAWYTELKTYLLSSGFVNSQSDTSLFILLHNNITMYVLVYVDDIIVTGSDSKVIEAFIKTLGDRFSLKDMGALSYFLGVEVHHTQDGLLLTQQKYITDLLAKVDMSDANPVSTPMANNSSLQLSSGSPLSDGRDYRTVVGSLQYLQFTRPDIAFAVNKLSQFMHQPTDVHWQAAKRVLRYLSGTRTQGLLLRRNNKPHLHAFTDADWAGNKDDYTSTGAYIVYLGSHPIVWSSKKQKTVARSSTEAEYRAVADTASELCWVLHLMSELGIQTTTQPVIYCDNMGATYLSANPVFHSRMKHVALNYHFVRQLVQSKVLRVAHISSSDQLADCLTKPLPRPRFEELNFKIGLTTGRSS